MKKTEQARAGGRKLRLVVLGNEKSQHLRLEDLLPPTVQKQRLRRGWEVAGPPPHPEDRQELWIPYMHFFSP